MQVTRGIKILDQGATCSKDKRRGQKGRLHDHPRPTQTDQLKPIFFPIEYNTPLHQHCNTKRKKTKKRAFKGGRGKAHLAQFFPSFPGLTPSPSPSRSLSPPPLPPPPMAAAPQIPQYNTQSLEGSSKNGTRRVRGTRGGASWGRICFFPSLSSAQGFEENPR